MADIDQWARVVLALVGPVVNALIVLAILFLVARPVVKALGRPKVKTKDDRIETLARGTTYSPDEDDDRRLPEPLPQPAPPAPRPASVRTGGVAAMVRNDVRLTRARTLALAMFDRNPERCVTLLKIWLKQEA